MLARRQLCPRGPSWACREGPRGRQAGKLMGQAPQLLRPVVPGYLPLSGPSDASLNLAAGLRSLVHGLLPTWYWYRSPLPLCTSFLSGLTSKTKQKEINSFLWFLLFLSCIFSLPFSPLCPSALCLPSASLHSHSSSFLDLSPLTRRRPGPVPGSGAVMAASPARPGREDPRAPALFPPSELPGPKAAFPQAARTQNCFGLPAPGPAPTRPLPASHWRGAPGAGLGLGGPPRGSRPLPGRAFAVEAEQLAERIC